MAISKMPAFQAVVQHCSKEIHAMAKMAKLMKNLQRVEEILNSEGFPLTVAILAKIRYFKKLKLK